MSAAQREPPTNLASLQARKRPDRSVKETRAVNEWAKGIREPSEAVQRRLRAWFQGLNPQLDDRSPTRLLREGDIDEVGPEVIAAERAFLVGG
jgi:hypothetical protein